MPTRFATVSNKPLNYMKYWTTRHWENWHRFIECLEASLRDQEITAPDAEGASVAPTAVTSTAEFEVDEPEPSETNVVQPPEFADPPVEPTAVEFQDEEAIADTIEETLGALFPDAKDLEPTVEESFVETPAIRTEPISFDVSARSNHFFASIPWGGALSEPKPAECTEPDSPLSSSPAIRQIATSTVPLNRSIEPIEITAQAQIFFGSVPWDSGAIALDEDAGDEVMSISIGTPGHDSGADVRSAALPADNMLAAGLMSATKTSDRLDSGGQAVATLGSRSRDFFNLIPW